MLVFNLYPVGRREEKMLKGERYCLTLLRPHREPRPQIYETMFATRTSHRPVSGD